MAAGLLIFPGAFPSRALNGDRIAAQIAFYENGAPGTPKTVYADVGLTTPLANPVHSDALGNFPTIYADAAQEFTAIWSTDDGQSKTLDDLSASTAANQTILDQTEAARDQAEVYRDETAALKGLTQDALDDALALYGGMAAVNAAVTASQAARDQSQAYRNQAEGFKNDAQAASGTATTQAGIATTKAAEAATSAGAAKSYVGGLGFTFSTTTSDSDPGPGNLRLNNATPSAATFIYADNVDADGLTASAWLDTFDNSSSSVKGTLFLRDGVTGGFAIFNVIGAVIDGTGFRKIPVAYVGGGGAFTNANRVGMTFSATGDTPSSSTLLYVAKTGAYTVVTSDWGKIIDCTSGTFTLSFSSAAALGNGFSCYVKNSGTGVITLPTIDGQPRTLYPGEAALVESNGTDLHWLWLNADPGPHLHVREEYASGGGPAAPSAGWNTRVLNTTLRNLLGSSLSSNEFTLPAGNYYVEASAPAYKTTGHRLRLYNVTDAASMGTGQNAYSGAADATQTPATMSFSFTLAAQKTIRLEHYVASNSGATLGQPFGSTDPEILAVVKIWKRPQ